MRVEDLGDLRAQKAVVDGLRRSVAGFCASCLAVLAAGALVTAYFLGRSVAVDIAAYTAPVIVAFGLFSLLNGGLFSARSGRRVKKFEAANMLTALRLFLVPPMAVFLVSGHLVWGMSTYALILITDVLDGWVARRFDQETVFGVMVDPFADIASTIAAFTWLWRVDAVPGWLFVILIVRYLEFFLGIAVLKVLGRPPELKATLAGKAAGVVQGLGILMLAGFEALGLTGRYSAVQTATYYLLAAAFFSVVVSQTVLGMAALRKNDD